MTKDKIINKLEEALLFYADPDSYFAITFLSDSPCGEFITDFDKEYEFINYIKPMPGKRARQVLKKIEDK